MLKIFLGKMNKMGNVIRLADHIYPWKLSFASDSEHSTLQVYVNERSGEIEVVQMNDEGEAIRTCLNVIDSANLSEAVSRAHQKTAKK